MAARVGLALIGLGTAVVVVSSLGALRCLRDRYAMLHFVTPVTSLGGPLIGLGVAVQMGWSLSSGEVLLVVALLAGSAPALQAATGRSLAQQDGRVPTDSPQ